MNCKFRSGWVAALIVVASLAPGASGQISYPKRPTDTTTLEKMRSGTVSLASNPRNQDLLDALASWLADRLAHPPFNGKEPAAKSLDDIESLMDEVNRWCVWPNPRQPPNEMQVEYAKGFGEAMAKRIMGNYERMESRLEKLNAIRMLAIVGKLPDPALADLYLRIIREPTFPPEVKLYAFEGLRNLLSIPDPAPVAAAAPPAHFIKSNEKLAEIAKELEKYITFKCAPNLTPDQARVVQYIRREAVRALAAFKVGVVRQQQAALASPIATLARVATNDKFLPASEHALPGYSFHPLERIEAVIGICQMAPDKQTNLDLAVAVVNDAMIDIGTFHGKEKADIQKDPRNKPLVPWRITGVRLADAFGQWKKNATNTHLGIPASRNPKFVSDWSDAATKTAAKLEADGVNAVFDTRFFEDWKRDTTRKPKATLLVEDVPATKVDYK